ncbi:hypothetical protein, partial [Candidatus Ichthyocystis hellenicum]|uniref:hypothetical protein n=1 Tax=Candidatus Ichthyocystis hellenicum TaxID=1561003 RepID=UPI001584CB7C
NRSLEESSTTSSPRASNSSSNEGVFLKVKATKVLILSDEETAPRALRSPTGTKVSAMVRDIENRSSKSAYEVSTREPVTRTKVSAMVRDIESRAESRANNQINDGTAANRGGGIAAKVERVPGSREEMTAHAEDVATGRRGVATPYLPESAQSSTLDNQMNTPTPDKIPTASPNADSSTTTSSIGNDNSSSNSSVNPNASSGITNTATTGDIRVGNQNQNVDLGGVSVTVNVPPGYASPPSSPATSAASGPGSDGGTCRLNLWLDNAIIVDSGFGFPVAGGNEREIRLIMNTLARLNETPDGKNILDEYASSYASDPEFVIFPSSTLSSLGIRTNPGRNEVTGTDGIRIVIHAPDLAPGEAATDAMRSSSSLLSTIHDINTRPTTTILATMARK